MWVTTLRRVMLHLTLWPFSHRQRVLREKKKTSGSGVVVCFFSLSLSKEESRFRSESYALEIHGKVRGQGSGFQQHHISRIWGSVSPGSSGSRNSIWLVQLTRQTQVSIRVYRSKQSPERAARWAIPQIVFTQRTTKYYLVQCQCQWGN